MDALEEMKMEKEAVAPKSEAPKAAPAKVEAKPAKAATKALADKFFVVKEDRMLSMKNGMQVHLRAGKKISQANYGGEQAIKDLIAAGVKLEEVKE